MKQVQYRRAAQSTGFRPVQVSGNEIARMREESARVVQGMRDVRNAEIRQREEQLAQQKENQRLEARQRETNRQIQSQNLNNTLTGLQQEARAQQQQYQQNQSDNAQLLKSISSISESAGKAYGEYVEAKDAEAVAQALDDYLENGLAQDLYALQGEFGLDVQDEVRQSQLDEYELRGGDPLVTAKSRNYNDRVRREIQKGKAAYFFQYKYQGLLNEAIKAQEAKLGRRLEQPELAAYMTDVRRIVVEKFGTEGGVNLKPGSMRTGLEFSERVHQSYLSSRRDEELKNELQRTLETNTTILTQNPTEFANNIAASFKSVYRANGYDYAKAHDWYETLATMRGPDGNFLFTEEQLASVVLQAGEKPYAQERPGRFGNMMRARQEDDNKFRRQQITADDLAYKEAVLNAREQIIANPTKETAETLLGYFRDVWGKQPEILVKYDENFTVEARAKAKQIEELESKTTDGFILKEHVDALKRLDVTAGKELEERYAAQEARYNSGVYKQLSDSFKTTANGVTSFGSQKPNSPASLALQRGMRAEFRRRVDQRAGSGADIAAFNTAAELVAQEIAAEVKAGAKDPNSLFYRKVSKPGGAAEFPNLYSQANLTAYEESRRSYQAIVNSVKDKGLEATLDTAESVLTREEIESIISGYGKPGFVIPTDVLAVTGMGNGLDPFTVINRQIAALGDPNLLPIEPPAIINSINNTMTEKQRQDLFNAVNGPRQRMRALHSSVGTQLNYRAGLPVASATAPKVTPREVYDYMRELGVSDIHAKGILANIQGESGFQPDVMGDNGMSGGLFQMYNDRYRKMELSVPDWRTNWKGQVKHALQDDTAPQYLQMQFNSPEEAADWFLENYERPAIEHRPGRRELNRSFIPNLGF